MDKYLHLKNEIEGYEEILMFKNEFSRYKFIDCLDDNLDDNLDIGDDKIWLAPITEKQVEQSRIWVNIDYYDYYVNCYNRFYKRG